MKIRIFVRELYCEEADVLLLVDWFLKNTKGLQTYFCRYENEKKNKYFLRVGFLNPKKTSLNKFDKLVRNHSFITRVRTWEEHPKTKEFDMEMMKFLAFETFIVIKDHYKKYEKYYLGSKMRDRNTYGLKQTDFDRTQMSAMDYAHYTHHIFNMMGKSYIDEVYLHGYLGNNMLYNALISELKS